jgi:hypothetical protein
LGAHHIAAKQIIAPALNSIAGGPSKLYGGSRGLIQAAIDALVKRSSAQSRAAIYEEISTPSTCFGALIGISHVASGPGWQQSARLVDILITASRPGMRPA